MVDNNIPKPKISEKFTVEDIHKIREWNYERFKTASKEEREVVEKKELSDVHKFMEKFKKAHKRASML